MTNRFVSGGARRLRRNNQRILWAAAAIAVARSRAGLADPILPTIGSAVYSITTSDPSVDGGATAVTGSTSTIAAANTTVINDYIQYASANGGGTVEVPAGTYLSNEILMQNNVNLDVETGATLQNFQTTNTFITAATNATGNIEISGGGIINSNATKTSDNKMVFLQGLNNVEVTNVTVENAPNEHLVTEDDNNVTINGVTIQDAKIQSNTDGIDFSGTNFLIENCNIADGDDDIVAKPDTTTKNGITAFTGNVVINNCTITSGHGISIGGQTNAGLNGMYVSNIIEDATGGTPLENAIHLKAGDGTTSSTENGGLVQNVTFNNFTITNADDALVLDSFYNNGDSNYPSRPSATSPFPVAPTDATEPLWKNITFENITINNATGNAGEIFGLNSTPPNLDGLNFININATTNNPLDMYYASDVYMSGVNINGTAIPDFLDSAKDSTGQDQSQEFADTFDGAPLSPIYTPLPEPSSLCLLTGAGLMALRRRRYKAPPALKTEH